MTQRLRRPRGRWPSLSTHPTTGGTPALKRCHTTDPRIPRLEGFQGGMCGNISWLAIANGRSLHKTAPKTEFWLFPHRHPRFEEHWHNLRVKRGGDGQLRRHEAPAGRGGESQLHRCGARIGRGHTSSPQSMPWHITCPRWTRAPRHDRTHRQVARGRRASLPPNPHLPPPKPMTPSPDERSVGAEHTERGGARPAGGTAERFRAARDGVPLPPRASKPLAWVARTAERKSTSGHRTTPPLRSPTPGPRDEAMTMR